MPGYHAPQVSSGHRNAIYFIIAGSVHDKEQKRSRSKQEEESLLSRENNGKVEDRLQGDLSDGVTEE